MTTAIRKVAVSITQQMTCSVRVQLPVQYAWTRTNRLTSSPVYGMNRTRIGAQGVLEEDVFIGEPSMRRSS